MTGSAIGDSLEYCMVYGHVCIVYLFLSNLIKMVNLHDIFVSWVIVSDAWIPNNWEFTVYSKTSGTRPRVAVALSGD
jgi:hypothetical protein